MSWFDGKDLIIPIDFSDSSLPALQEGVKMATDKTKVHVVHVMPPLDFVSPGVVLGEVNNKDREKHVHEAAAEIFAKAGLTDSALKVLTGDPGLEVTDYAKQFAAPVIVVPSHGFHGVKRFLLGSVAERIIRHAQCPVFVLRRPDAD